MDDDDRFLIDRRNVYESLGHDKIIQLSTCFYNRVFDDDDEENWKDFGQYFHGRDKAEAIRNQYEFFIERFGGPPLFSQRKGHPALRARHRNFGINDRSAERWLHHMKHALDEVKIQGPDREALDQYFQHTAYFLRNKST